MQVVQKRALAILPSGCGKSPSSLLLSRHWHSPPYSNFKLPLGAQNRPARKALPQRAFYSTTIEKHAVGQQKSANAPCDRPAATVPIVIDGTEVDFSAVLLRDRCACPLCVHESTNQRLFSTADIPRDIQARLVEVDTASDSVAVRWKNDVPGYTSEHSTKLDVSALRELGLGGPQRDSEKHNLEQSLWSQSALNLPDYDYGTYLHDDAALHGVIRQLQTHGLAFVTKITGNEGSLAAIATRIGPIKDTFYGYTWDVRTVPQAINAAYTSHDLGFHTDLLYFQQPPHIQLLHCIQSASTGGASVFADAYRAAVDLFHMDPDAFDTLATVPVNYHYNHPDSNIYRTTKPVFGLHPLRVGNTVYTHFGDYLEAQRGLAGQEEKPGWAEAMLVDRLDKINWGPPFLAPFTNHEGPTIPHTAEPAIEVLNRKVDAWHKAAVKFNELLQRPEYLYERKMKPGECVLFDNTRTLHSRRAFDVADVGKPRWLRGTYVDKDPFYSKLRVLQQKFGRGTSST